MPSIPQSLLWISLVVLWLFVLVPMLISKRDTVRRTSDVALATRVVNTGSGARLLRRRKPAAGHHSDPDWRPTHEEIDEYDDDDPVTDPRKAVVVMAAAKVEAESEYLDVDVVDEDSGALPLGATARTAFDQEPVLPLVFDDNTATFTVDDLQEVDEVTGTDEEFEDEDEFDADAEAEFATDDEAMTDEFATAAADDYDYDYEYVDDSSGLEASPDPDLHVAGTKSQERRRAYESKTAAAVSARKFRFRKRMLMAMSALLLSSAIAAYVVSPTFWWVCGTVGVVTVLYLGYLRRQTRIEEQVRRRRAPAHDALAPRRREHSRPGVRRRSGPVAAPRISGVGDRRRGSDLRAFGLCPVRT